MKAEFYVSNMGSFFLDLDNTFSDVVVGCTSSFKTVNLYLNWVSHHISWTRPVIISDRNVPTLVWKWEFCELLPNIGMFVVKPSD